MSGEQARYVWKMEILLMWYRLTSTLTVKHDFATNADQKSDNIVNGRDFACPQIQKEKIL